MPIEQWSEDVAVVHMADDPQFTDEMGLLDGKLQKHKMDVVLDMAAVHYLNSSNLSRLLKLRKTLTVADRKLLLCSVAAQVWSAILVTGLDKVFEVADNVPLALATLQMGNEVGEDEDEDGELE